MMTSQSRDLGAPLGVVVGSSVTSSNPAGSSRADDVVDARGVACESRGRWARGGSSPQSTEAERPSRRASLRSHGRAASRRARTSLVHLRLLGCTAASARPPRERSRGTTATPFLSPTTMSPGSIASPPMTTERPISPGPSLNGEFGESAAREDRDADRVHAVDVAHHAVGDAGDDALVPRHAEQDVADDRACS